jgi:hypothetical protein
MQEALVSGLVALVVAGLTSWASIHLQKERLRQELKTEFMAEQAMLELLQHPSWTLRSFEAISRRFGGFDGDELRRLLVRSGALRFEKQDGTEMWGLRTRNTRLLGGERDSS